MSNNNLTFSDVLGDIFDRENSGHYDHIDMAVHLQEKERVVGENRSVVHCHLKLHN